MGSFTKLTYHIVFGTKYRRRTICRDFQKRLFDYLGGAVRGMDGVLIEVGGVEDHLHLLANLPPTKALSEVVRDIKAGSSKWLNTLPECQASFEWQKGYAAFTVSYSQVVVVQQYVAGQEEHHRRKTFKEEYIELLQRHEITFEAQYLFEAEHHG